MAKIYTINLEFLRHGRAYNQLLSPLTQYLGLCGNYGASTVHVPYEHQEFLSRLKSLRYGIDGRDDDERRQFDLTKTAEDIAKILASIPGLVSSLGAVPRDKMPVTHLDLVLSASELAMLPFELAKVPPGCVGGEGNWLLLQTVLPVCLTRRVRSISCENIVWPDKPKILFIIAQHRNMSVPARQHTHALLKAIKPWVRVFDASQPGEWNPPIGEILTILPQASMNEIEAACAENAYTHVHILAHGMENKRLPGSPYGLALHNSHDKSKIDVVIGEQLASALRPLRIKNTGEETPRQNATNPAVVTVAACDSGNVGSVIYNNGASLAHALHQAGIPIVVASQFPLSKTGSVHVAEVLYGRMLWGEDPRILLQHLRSRLHALSADTHDWASLVTYAALPDNLEDQLKDVRYVQAKRAMDIALSDIDKSIDKMEDQDPSMSTKKEVEQLDVLFRCVDEAAKHLPTTGEYETEGRGVLASAAQRKAEAYFRASKSTQAGELHNIYASNSMNSLKQSLHYYEQAYRENMQESAGVIRKHRSVHWVMGQYLSVRAVLCEAFLRDHWGTAMVSSEADLMEKSGKQNVWPHGSLAELYLILLAYNPKHVPITQKEVRDKTLEHVRSLLSIAGFDSFAVYSTRRQFNRYITWWGSELFESMLAEEGRVRERPWTKPGGLIEIANKAVKTLTK